MKKRILTGAALVAIVTFSIRTGRFSFIALILAVNFLALQEFYRIFRSCKLSPRQLPGIFLSISLLLTCTQFIMNRNSWEILLLNIPIAFGIFIIELYLKSETPFQNLAISFLGIICITIPLCFLVSIAFLPVRTGTYNYETILGYFFILWAGDSGAYLVGKYFGRHTLFKRISPGKTWEGSLGGIVCALFMAFVTSRFYIEIDPLSWLLMAAIIIVTGTFGDLIKSLMKRSLQIKDSGKILPGHGGMLDRFDSLLGSAPFVFCFLDLFVYV